MELAAATQGDVPELVELLGILFAQEHELTPDLRVMLLTDGDNTRAGSDLAALYGVQTRTLNQAVGSIVARWAGSTLRSPS